jgi:aminodeoxyfutalosine deaminase
MRKLSANYIFDGYKLLKNSILVLDSGNSVVELINTEGDLREQAGVEFYNGIICPGFVNSHCHLELSHLHNQIVEGIGLDNFVRKVVTLRNFPQQEVLDNIEKQNSLMKQSGIVAVGDISNNIDTYYTKENSSIRYYTFMEVFDLHDISSTQTKFDTIYNQYLKFTSTQNCSIVPHASYSCSSKMFELLNDFYTDKNLCVSVHNQETETEDEMFLNGQGRLFDFFVKSNPGYNKFQKTNKSSLKTLVDSLPIGNRYIFVHNTFTQQADLEYATKKYGIDNCFWCLCPQSNWYIERQQPNYEMFINQGVNIVVGTDSLASNKTLSILEELKFIQLNNPDIELVEMLKWLTINGAKAMKLDSQIGSFEIGNTPGVNLIQSADLQNLNYEKTRM